MTAKAAIGRESIARAGTWATTPTMPPSRVATNHQRVGESRNVPLFIPADQAYYWSSKWQSDEAESLADLAAGRARTFDDPASAIRHLLSDD